MENAVVNPIKKDDIVHLSIVPVLISNTTKSSPQPLSLHKE